MVTTNVVLKADHTNVNVQLKRILHLSSLFMDGQGPGSSLGHVSEENELYIRFCMVS